MVTAPGRKESERRHVTFFERRCTDETKREVKGIAEGGGRRDAAVKGKKRSSVTASEEQGKEKGKDGEKGREKYQWGGHTDAQRPDINKKLRGEKEKKGNQRTRVQRHLRVLLRPSFRSMEQGGGWAGRGSPRTDPVSGAARPGSRVEAGSEV